jgi:hypothetical protein
VLGGERRRTQELRRDAPRQEEHTGDDHQCEGEEAAKGVADDRRYLVQPEILEAPAVLDDPRGVEVDLVGSHRRTQQAYDEVEVDHQAAAGVRAGHEPVGDVSPVGMKLDRRDREDEQAKTEIAEDALDPPERQHPGADGKAEDRKRDQETVGKTGEELEADGYASDLGRAGHQVDDLGGDQGRESRTEAGPLTDKVEDRTLGDRRDAPAHLRIDDDPRDSDHDDPQQLEAKDRAGLRVEDEIADVDETADRRHDSKGDREHVLQAHPSPLPICSLCRAAV